VSPPISIASSLVLGIPREIATATAASSVLTFCKMTFLLVFIE
jgi:hypothetical protein